MILFLPRWSRGNRLKVLTAIRCDQWRLLHQSRGSFHRQLDAAPGTLCNSQRGLTYQLRLGSFCHLTLQRGLARKRPALQTPGRLDQCPLLVKHWPGHRGLNHILIVIDLGKCKAWQRPAIDPRAGRVALRIRLHRSLGCRARDTQLGAKRVLMWLDAIQKMSPFCCAIVFHQSH